MRYGLNILLSLFLLVLVSSCAKPLMEAKVESNKIYSQVISADANTIYYAIKWAFDQTGYPSGPEDLAGGVLETKWVPTGAASHYIDIFDGRDYGANAAYYKMIVKIVPMSSGNCRVEANTVVKSVVKNLKTTGDKEREILEKVAEHARGYDIQLSNLGVEE